jgi:YfiH family protein
LPAALRSGLMLQPDWPAPARIIAFSTTRNSGDSARPAALRELPEPRITQVHGTRIVDAHGLAEPAKADGIVSREVGVVCRVETADCLPVLLCDRSGSQVAAVHAGWRGLAAGILEATIDRLSGPRDELLAWIGPAISQAHYEVNLDLREAFTAAAGPDQQDAVARCFTPRADRFLADLVGLARLRLAACGVEAVYGGTYCTYADPSRFHSWRRDGSIAGRMVSGICIVPDSV